MTASSAAYGPINKTTFSETADGSVIRRMPNLVKFREDPDAMLVMSLEDYDEVTGKAAKAAIMQQGRGRQDAAHHARRHRAEEGLLVSLDQQRRGRSAVHRQLYGKPEEQVIAELGDLIYRDPEIESLADRRRLSLRQCAGQARRRRARRPGLMPATPRPCGTCSPRTCCPATSTPISAHRGYRKPTSRRSPPSCSSVEPSAIPVGHLKKDAVWSVEADYAAEAVGRRHRRVRHATGQRHLAARAGPQHEDAGDLRHDP